MHEADDADRHAWFIEEREYRRHEQRRGRRYAYEQVIPRRTALVVVDLVPFFVEGSGFARGIIPQVNRLAACVRGNGGTVAWVVPGRGAPTSAAREFYGDVVAEKYARSSGEGEPKARLWHELDFVDGDVAVEKTASSAYFPGRSQLPDLLAARGIDTLIIAGTVTNVCVEATARDASTQGLRVILAADACAAMRDQDHNATLHTIYRSYGDVRPTDDILGLMVAPATVRELGDNTFLLR